MYMGIINGPVLHFEPADHHTHYTLSRDRLYHALAYAFADNGARPFVVTEGFRDMGGQPVLEKRWRWLEKPFSGSRAAGGTTLLSHRNRWLLGLAQTSRVFGLGATFHRMCCKWTSCIFYGVCCVGGCCGACILAQARHGVKWRHSRIHIYRLSGLTHLETLGGAQYQSEQSYKHDMDMIHGHNSGKVKSSSRGGGNRGGAKRHTRVEASLLRESMHAADAY